MSTQKNKVHELNGCFKNISSKQMTSNSNMGLCFQSNSQGTSRTPSEPIILHQQILLFMQQNVARAFHMIQVV
ncbi:hypothetical protein SADUNF_Sadunf16G0122900 [Salix dunnii]|uniref:Uncharacterized protein n=1 Tax=Salix dunnii TaxID=1413687 RepID=A0A835J9T5_9ROSI|nr:hypothetical protein SADUNF_Sadunf16G0122900 [Salix dunnii]